MSDTYTVRRILSSRCARFVRLLTRFLLTAFVAFFNHVNQIHVNTLGLCKDQRTDIAQKSWKHDEKNNKGNRHRGYLAIILLGNWWCDTRMGRWNELLGQGIKFRKELFQFPYTVIAVGIQCTYFIIRPALAHDILAIRLGHLRLPCLLLIPRTIIMQLIYSTLLHFYGEKRRIVSCHRKQVHRQPHFSHSHACWCPSLLLPAPFHRTHVSIFAFIACPNDTFIVLCFCFWILFLRCLTM